MDTTDRRSPFFQAVTRFVWTTEKLPTRPAENPPVGLPRPFLPAGRYRIENGGQINVVDGRSVLKLPGGDAARNAETLGQIDDDRLDIGTSERPARFEPGRRCGTARQEELARKRFRTRLDGRGHPGLEDLNRAKRMTAVEQEVTKLVCERHARALTGFNISPGAAPVKDTPARFVEKDAGTVATAPDREAVERRRLGLRVAHCNTQIRSDRENLDLPVFGDPKLLSYKPCCRFALNERRIARAVRRQ